MKIPESPPPYLDLIGTVSTDRLLEIMGIAQKDDRYLHWSELKRRPPPEGLSHREWWFALKMKRQGKPIPLKDKGGRQFSFVLPDALNSELHEIDCGLGKAWGLPEAVTGPASRNEYMISTLIQEAITSSQLEGAATTRRVAKDMLISGRKPRDKSEQMILNNYLTMQRIITLHQQEMTPELVLEIHRLVTEKTLATENAAGRLRRPDERICVADMENTIFHDPPPAGELIERMNAMCDFANAKTPGYFVHPAVRAVLLHFWLAYDHPFVDGNGRTARALFYWSMRQQGYNLFEYISISQILLRAPAQYANAFLYVETDGGDLTYFLLHQARVIRDAVDALHAYVEHKKADLQLAEKRLRGIDLNHRQQALIAHALREPGRDYTIEGHRASHGVVYETARSDLFALHKLGLLTLQKKRRTLIFRAERDLGKRLDKISVK